MDFLSKINANAGIDVKKGGCVVASIDNNRAEFTMSEFDVHAGGGVNLNNGTGVELNMCNDELKLRTNAHHIKMNTEFLEFCAAFVPMNIRYDSNHGINISDSHDAIGKLSFNTEFFKLNYGEPSSNKYAGPAFEITSKLSNSYSDVEDDISLPTAEIKSQRLDISAYSKNDNDFPASITLRVTPTQFINDITEAPTYNNTDARVNINEYGINLDSGLNPDGNAIDISTNGVNGLISLSTSNLEIFAGHREVNGQFVGGIIDTQSYTNSISAASYINLQTGGDDVAGLYHGGASIKLSSGLDGGAAVKVKTTEFLVDLASESSVVFNFGPGLRTYIDFGGITFNNSATIGIPASVDGRLTFCSSNMLFETCSLAVALRDGGGCMVFNNNGLNVSTTPTGASAPLSGNVLLSQSLRSIERMTQSEYDALAVKDENTLYIIAG